MVHWSIDHCLPHKKSHSLCVSTVFYLEEVFDIMNYIDDDSGIIRLFALCVFTLQTVLIGVVTFHAAGHLVSR